MNIAHRDWGIVTCGLFKEGQQFMSALGVYDHFTVAGGLPKGSFATRERGPVLEASELFWHAVQRDEALLRYDYSYSFSTHPSQRHSGGQSGIRIRGLVGNITTRPHGFCWLELSKPVASEAPQVVEAIDMRLKRGIETDALGTLKVHRRKAEMRWLETLPVLIEFLRARTSPEVRIEHYEEAV